MAKAKTVADEVKPDATPPEDPDAKLLKGAPQLAPEDGSPPPDQAEDEPEAEGDGLVSITVGGQEFKVPADQASAYATQQAEYSRRLTATQEVVEEGPAEAEGTDYSTTLFTDPNAALAQFKQEIREEVISEVTESYKQEKNLNAFWSDFYKANSDLKDEDATVRAIFTRDYPNMAGLPVQEASDTLAKSARTEILGIVNRHKGTGRRKNAADSLESGGTGTAPEVPKKQEPSKEPVSLSAAIRARSRARRQTLSSNSAA